MNALAPGAFGMIVAGETTSNPVGAFSIAVRTKEVIYLALKGFVGGVEGCGAVVEVDFVVRWVREGGT